VGQEKKNLSTKNKTKKKEKKGDQEYNKLQCSTNGIGSSVKEKEN
jgi:hypothetical protein